MRRAEPPLRYYLLLCGWAFCAVNATMLAMAVAVPRQAAMGDVLPLPDVGHALLPVLPIYVPDVCLCAVIVLTACRKCVPSLAYARVLAFVYIIRACVIVCTTYPRIDHKTYYGSSADLMFSGHTVAFWACADLLTTPRATWRWFTYALRFGAPLLIVASRQHYTADVIVSMAIMFFVPHRQDCWRRVSSTAEH